MNKAQKCPWCDGDNTRAEYDAMEGLWWQQHDCSECGFKHEGRVSQLTPADDLAYIKANTPSATNVEFVNTGIDNNGWWFIRSSRDAAAVAMTDYYTKVKDFADKVGEPVIYHNPPLPITISWQPIGTIPEKHGDQLLVHGSGHYAVVSYYDNTIGLEEMTNGWYISDGANDPIWHRAQYMMTEWMQISSPKRKLKP